MVSKVMLRKWRRLQQNLSIARSSWKKIQSKETLRNYMFAVIDLEQFETELTAGRK